MGVEKGDVLARTEYARSSFWSSSITSGEARRSVCPQIVFATQPEMTPLEQSWGGHGQQIINDKASLPYNLTQLFATEPTALDDA